MATPTTIAAERDEAAGPPAERAPVVNDFSIQVATINGSGSQSANNILMRAIFRMGVPVSGKNLFPSNIAGLPTWFTIRANKDGWVARKKEIDVLVLMNPNTVQEDIRDAIPGAAVIYNDDFDKLELIPKRDDVILYPVPFTKLVVEACPDAKLRRLVVNMIYVGIAARLLAIDPGVVEAETRKQFGKKAKALEINLAAVRAGYRHAAESIAKRDPYRIERMDATEGKFLIEGNAAAALGAMFAGCTVVTWYPITPSSSLCESLIGYCRKHRIDPKTGKATFAIVQAEDEIAAIGMVIGAGWAGARAMTSTSGPGISLMAEFVGLAYFAEVPAVIVDVQRIGPSTGLPTRTSQGDVLEVAFLSHGDTQHVALFPSSVEECFEMMGTAFDLAERLQAPIFVMSDLDLGMNNWMADPFPYPEKPIDRGKVLTSADLDRLHREGKHWERYRDVDGDAIPYRTLPGMRHRLGGYFTRGSGHNEKAQYTEKPQDYKNLMDRLARKHETARRLVPGPVVQEGEAPARTTGAGHGHGHGHGPDEGDRDGAGAAVGIIAYGTSDPAVKESRYQLAKETGLATAYLRIRAIPFDRAAMRAFLAARDRVYVVEQNRDGQMAALLKMELPEAATKLRPVLHDIGLPIDARFVTDEILRQEMPSPQPSPEGRGGKQERT